MKKTGRLPKAGDKYTIAGVRFGKYSNGRIFTTRCWKGKETVLIVESNETMSITEALSKMADQAVVDEIISKHDREVEACVQRLLT